MDLVDVEPIKQAKMTIVVDSMWGAGMGWLKGILAGGNLRIVEIHDQRNPIFPEMSRPEPIAPNLQALFAAIRAHRANAGIATDGDADRVGFADENGEFINQLQVYGLLALYLLEVRGWRGPIVKTLSTTSMLDILGQQFGVPVYETGVGFKYVAPKMLETNAIIGGEESGGYAFRGHMPERDGILAALFLLDFMVKTGKSAAQLVEYLFSKVGPHYYDRLDAHYPLDQREAITAYLLAHPPSTIDGTPVVRVQTDDGFKYHLADGSWLLIRFSGTEPIMRIYTETTSKERIRRILGEGQRLVRIG